LTEVGSGKLGKSGSSGISEWGNSVINNIGINKVNSACISSAQTLQAPKKYYYIVIKDYLSFTYILMPTGPNPGLSSELSSKDAMQSDSVFNNTELIANAQELLAFVEKCIPLIKDWENEPIVQQASPEEINPSNNMLFQVMREQ
jgi:hypothetical protein